MPETPDHDHDLHGRFSVVPAAYVVFLRGQTHTREVLLQLRQGTGYMDDHWACAAAGHVERGESVFAAAAREAEEEVALTDVVLTPLTAMQRSNNTGLAIDERVDYFFACTAWTGEPRIVEPDKCADLRWFRLDSLPDPVVPHELAVLTGVRDGALQPIVTHGF
ncbi:MAG TPA: NUDIX domain-containing protein [Nocardioides sp.]|uniref:NUDIX domain-containing protein n=1 Tax=Nocardioides sp. TaxID=35761 RepID=UPI002D7EFED9|nr:NUDIX domain-containing protein [Nocardioides sp.]HET6653345.1 NUDIX domain-containing protein [Nocardioides sp.]